MKLSNQWVIDASLLATICIIAFVLGVTAHRLNRPTIYTPTAAYCWKDLPYAVDGDVYPTDEHLHELEAPGPGADDYVPCKWLPIEKDI